MKRAAIAIGSNSTRMLVADAEGGVLRNLLRGREETRLFLGLDGEGNISPEKIESTAQAVASLYRDALEWGAQSVDLFATSAARDAANGNAFAKRIKELTGLDLRIIPGEEEARLAFTAVSSGERRMVMDIGGGSTEWTLGENNKVEWAVSMQIGASRLLKTQRFEGPEDAARVQILCKEVMGFYARQLQQLPPAPVLIGLGGTCSTAAAITLGREAHGEEVEGIVVEKQAVIDQLIMLSSMTVEERRQVPGLPPSRAAHYPLGLCILISSMDLLGFQEFTVSGKTNMDGYLLNLSKED
ncbi:MAG: hypothetical protein IKH57_18355 [Clostridia bacterium]|nr:hypothetical protein [Clostridia bacterium]